MSGMYTVQLEEHDLQRQITDSSVHRRNCKGKADGAHRDWTSNIPETVSSCIRASVKVF